VAAALCPRRTAGVGWLAGADWKELQPVAAIIARLALRTVAERIDPPRKWLSDEAGAGSVPRRRTRGCRASLEHLELVEEELPRDAAEVREGTLSRTELISG